MRDPARFLLTFALLSAATGWAQAGMDVSLEREFRRLSEIHRRVENLPAYQASEELKRQISALGQRFERLGGQPRARIEAERQDLRRQIDALQMQLDGLAKIIVDFRETISHGQRDRFFPGVRHRIAVFTFDDPDNTGLGDPISFLLSKKLLFSTRVRSFAIVNYRQGADRDPGGKLAYFDRVDAITNDQRFLLATWGRLSRSETGVRIDSFLQVPADANAEAYGRRIRLPEAMGSGTLTVRIKPDRVLLQSLNIGPEGTRALQSAAEQVATLRARPSVSAPITGRLGEGRDYAAGRAYRIVGSQRDWVRLAFDGGGGGWTSVDQFCTGICHTLLDVANFTNDVVALTSALAPRPMQRSLTREAEAMAQQLAALGMLSENPSRAIDIAERWAVGRDGSPPPGGASFANLLAVAQIQAELKDASSRQPNFDRIRLDRATVTRITRPLAQASVADPGNVEAVENLAVLFGYVGDDKRRSLALDIVANLKARAR